MIKWFLRNNPSLLGDLLEERASGRSLAWYWRQIAVAIGRSIFEEARENPVLTLRAVATTLVVYFSASAIAFFGYGYLSGYLSPAFGDPYNSHWLLIPLIFVPAAVAGWIVARTHRSCVAAAITAIVIIWAPIAMPINFWTPAAQITGLISGALVAAYRRRSPATINVLK